MAAGLKFRPNDEENIKYLVGKVFGTMACDEELIGTADLYGEQEPWEIFGDWEDKELHLFTPLKRAGNQKTGQRISRTVGQGVWSNKGQKDPILGGKRGGQVIGHKRCFRYERKKKDDDGKKGNWLLKEYTLPDSLKGRMKEEYRDYALCILKRKQDGAGRRKSDLDCPEIGFDEMMEFVRNSGPQAVPSCRGGGGDEEPSCRGGGDEEWLQTIDWNVEPGFDFGGEIVEPGGDFGQGKNVVDPGGDFGQGKNAVDPGGDFDFVEPGGDFGQVDWNGGAFGFGGGDFGVFDQGGNVPCSVDGLFGIEYDYLPANVNRRLSAPLIPL